MARIDVNLDAVEDAEGDAHPDGETLTTVAKSEIRPNKNGDGQHILWTLKVNDSDNKRPLWLRHSLKPKALWNLKQFLQAAGFRWESDGSFDTADVHGSEVFVQVKQREFEGKLSNEVGPPYKAAR